MSITRPRRAGAWSRTTRAPAPKARYRKSRARHRCCIEADAPVNYRAPWWLPGGNLQTIWPALYARRYSGEHPQYRRERWATPDGDVLVLDWLQTTEPATPERPLLVLFH